MATKLSAKQKIEQNIVTNTNKEITAAKLRETLIEIVDATGESGKSAYQLALDSGFIGTLAEWLLSLTGEPGADGNPGSIGNPGASAYEVAVNAGFVGTRAAWLLSLKGEKGNPGEPGQAGSAGLSAYQIAVNAGFAGDLAAWLLSLKGEKGATGEIGPAGTSASPAGNNGEVQFRDGTVLSADSALFFDKVNKRLGIGINSPNHILSVNSGNAAMGIISLGAILGGGPLIYLQADPTQALTAFNSRLNFPFAILINNAERLRVTTDGFLGVRTSAPNSFLHVDGSAAFAIRNVAASTTLANTDYTLIFTGSTASQTITIPAASTLKGRIYIIANHSSVALSTSLAITTGNAAMINSIVAGSSVQIQSDGTVWRKIN